MPLIYCILNGSKKISAQNKQLLNELQAHFGEAFGVYTSINPQDAIDFIHTLGPTCTHLIGVGGDGTFNVLVNGTCKHPNNAFNPILGIIPNGTGNDFYRSAGFTKNRRILQSIQNGSFELFDIGRIETQTEQRYFANIADIGFGGAVVLELQNFRKKFGPNFSYGLAIIKTFLKYKRPVVKIESKDYNYNGELLLAAFCNGSIFGDGLYIHPGAKINDGQLKLTLLGKVSLVDYLLNVLKVKRGKQIRHPEAHYLSVSFPLVLSTENKHLHAETDGEYLGGQVFKIDLLPAKLKLLPFGQA